MTNKNYVIPKRFKWNENNDISSSMLSFWQNNGFLIIDKFYSNDECRNLTKRVHELINSHLLEDRVYLQDNSESKYPYFLKNSGNKISFFGEKNIYSNEKSLNENKDFNIKEIGHALHDLDPVFYEFSRKRSLAILATSLGLEMPLLTQSSYILNHSKTDPENSYKQDSSVFYTEPESCIGFWVALEDTTLEEGCLLTLSEGHPYHLKKIYNIKDNNLNVFNLYNVNFPKANVAIESFEGTLIVLSGRLPYIFKVEDSNSSNHTYKLNIVDGRSKYSEDNIVQGYNGNAFSGFFPKKKFFN